MNSLNSNWLKHKMSVRMPLKKVSTHKMKTLSRSFPRSWKLPKRPNQDFYLQIYKYNNNYYLNFNTFLKHQHTIQFLKTNKTYQLYCNTVEDRLFAHTGYIGRQSPVFGTCSHSRHSSDQTTRSRTLDNLTVFFKMVLKTVVVQ